MACSAIRQPRVKRERSREDEERQEAYAGDGREADGDEQRGHLASAFLIRLAVAFDGDPGRNDAEYEQREERRGEIIEEEASHGRQCAGFTLDKGDENGLSAERHGTHGCREGGGKEDGQGRDDFKLAGVHGRIVSIEPFAVNVGILPRQRQPIALGSLFLWTSVFFGLSLSS